MSASGLLLFYGVRRVPRDSRRVARAHEVYDLARSVWLTRPASRASQGQARAQFRGDAPRAIELDEGTRRRRRRGRPGRRPRASVRRPRTCWRVSPRRLASDGVDGAARASRSKRSALQHWNLARAMACEDASAAAAATSSSTRDGGGLEVYCDDRGGRERPARAGTPARGPPRPRMRRRTRAARRRGIGRGLRDSAPRRRRTTPRPPPRSGAYEDEDIAVAEGRTRRGGNRLRPGTRDRRRVDAPDAAWARVGGVATRPRAHAPPLGKASREDSRTVRRARPRERRGGAGKLTSTPRRASTRGAPPPRAAARRRARCDPARRRAQRRARMDVDT